MKLTIFAATGGTGKQILDRAVSAGHDVTVVVRSPGKVTADVRVIGADLATARAGDLEAAVRGADAVLSALGPRTRAEAGITARATGAIAEAMWSAGARRIVVVSAAPVGTVSTPAHPAPRFDPGDGFVMRHLLNPMVKRVLRAHYDDLARMEDVLRESNLDWTAVRPPRLTDGPATGAYRVAIDRNIRGGVTISRADVAEYMLRALDDPRTVGHAIGLAN
jgi:putative NADH-flavin reductase